VNPDLPTGVTPSKTKANLFPWIAAGGDGKIDIVWYHGEGGDTSSYRDPGTEQTQWTVAYTQLFDAYRADKHTHALKPDVQDINLAVTPVIHTGDVCNNGTLCGITGPGD